MSNKNIERFIETYGPVAQQVSKEINVDPNVLLSQWGLESRWGQSEMAKKHHNLGGIKDFSGHGFEAKDNKTGSVDKYVKFEDPEVFGMYYADQIKRNFPNAVNTGPDAGAFTRGLAAGKNGSYFGVSQDDYLKSLTSAQAAIPQDKALPFEPTAQPKTEEQNGDMQLGNAPPPPPPTVDTSGASAGERFLGGALGTGAGVASTGAQAFSSARTGMAANRAAAEERARIAAQRAAGAAPPAANVPPAGGPPPSVVRVNPQGGTPTPLGTPGTYPKATGPGSATYNYGRVYGLPEIEAGRALGTGKESGEVWDLLNKRQEGLNRIQQMGGGFTENPRYGGLMTPQPSVGSGPRQSFAFKPEVPPSPDVPKGVPGGLQALPKPAPIPTTPVGPSGLQQVTTLFTEMMRPVASGLRTAGKYVLPPVAGLSAGLDVAEMAHEYDKPQDQRDYTKMGLKGMGLVGGALSMFPPTMPLGLGLSVAAPALEYAREKGYFGEKTPEQVPPAP